MYGSSLRLVEKVRLLIPIPE